MEQVRHQPVPPSSRQRLERPCRSGYTSDALTSSATYSLELGGYALEGGAIAGVKLYPGVAIGLGLDYRLDRSWSVGVAVHQRFLADLSTLVRFEYVWGW